MDEELLCFQSGEERSRIDIVIKQIESKVVDTPCGSFLNCASQAVNGPHGRLVGVMHDPTTLPIVRKTMP